MTEPRTPRVVLAEALAGRADLVDAAVAIFDLAQFLLDDDERLTKSGALDGVGRDQLQARAIELLGGPPATDPDDEPDNEPPLSRTDDEDEEEGGDGDDDGDDEEDGA